MTCFGEGVSLQHALISLGSAIYDPKTISKTRLTFGLASHGRCDLLSTRLFWDDLLEYCSSALRRRTAFNKVRLGRVICRYKVQVYRPFSVT